MQDIWYCSSSQRICSVDVKSDLIKAVLGWKKPVAGRIAALQLLNIKDSYDAASSPSDREKMQQAFYHVLPDILNCLNQVDKMHPQIQGRLN